MSFEPISAIGREKPKAGSLSNYTSEFKKPKQEEEKQVAYAGSVFSTKPPVTGEASAVNGYKSEGGLNYLS